MNEEMIDENYSNPAALDIIVERKKNIILQRHQYMLLPELREALDELTGLARIAERKKSAD